MSTDAQRFAQRVIKAFEDAGHFTDKEVGQAGGPSTSTMTKLRKVAEGDSMPEPRGDTYRKIDRAADWRTGSARALWRNGTAPEAVEHYENQWSKPRTPQTVREQRAPRVDSFEAYVDHLANRLLETEERLDYLEDELRQQRLIGQRPRLVEAADDDQRTAQDEQEMHHDT